MDNPPENLLERISNGSIALTRRHAATVLGISPASLDRLTKRGLIRPSRALRRPLFPINELKRFLDETSGL